MPVPARSARPRPDGSYLRPTGTDPRSGGFAVPVVEPDGVKAGTDAIEGAPAGACADPGPGIGSDPGPGLGSDQGHRPGQGAAGPGREPSPTGAGITAPPAIGGARVPAAGVGTVLVARRRRT